jgi:hypothetical protein
MKIHSYRGLVAATAAGVLCGVIIQPRAAMAHGFEGDRFFPPTIQTDDPFATDELTLPNVQIFQDPGVPRVREIDYGAEFDKQILPDFDLEFSDAFTTLEPKQGHSTNGFQNFTLGFKDELIQIPDHEFIFSFGTEWEIGGTGEQNVGPNSYSTFTPTLYFGKGFGDLPDSVPMLKPFAITGLVGEALPTEASPNTLEWGFALEYSLIYLEQNVKDTGMPRPFRDMVPLVEFAMQTPEGRNGGPTTGTINPGVLYESRYFQIGAEAVIPVNGHSGSTVGAVVNVNIFIDDIWPKVFGHPIFGGASENSAPSAPLSAK